jgi:hypothetical protein
MRWFRLFPRPARPGTVRRARLGLEHLGDRALPSDIGGLVTVPPPGYTTPPVGGDTGAAPAYYTTPPAYYTTPPVGGDFQVSSQLVNFAANEIGHGYFEFTGRVLMNGTGAAGVTVTLDGLPSLVGQTVTTASDGTFTLFIQLQTDGTDNGTAEAWATVAGHVTNTALCDVYATP